MADKELSVVLEELTGIYEQSEPAVQYLMDTCMYNEIMALGFLYSREIIQVQQSQQQAMYGEFMRLVSQFEGNMRSLGAEPLQSAGRSSAVSRGHPVLSTNAEGSPRAHRSSGTVMGQQMPTSIAEGSPSANMSSVAVHGAVRSSSADRSSAALWSAQLSSGTVEGQQMPTSITDGSASAHRPSCTDRSSAALRGHHTLSTSSEGSPSAKRSLGEYVSSVADWTGDYSDEVAEELGFIGVITKGEIDRMPQAIQVKIDRFYELLKDMENGSLAVRKALYVSYRQIKYELYHEINTWQKLIEASSTMVSRSCQTVTGSRVQASCQTAHVSAVESSCQTAEVSAVETSCQTAEVSAVESSCQTAEVSAVETSCQTAEVSAVESSCQTAVVSAVESSCQTADVSAVESSCQTAEVSTVESSCQTANVSAVESSCQTAGVSLVEVACQSAGVNIVESSYQTTNVSTVESSCQAAEVKTVETSCQAVEVSMVESSCQAVEVMVESSCQAVEVIMVDASCQAAEDIMVRPSCQQCQAIGVNMAETDGVNMVEASGGDTRCPDWFQTDATSTPQKGSRSCMAMHGEYKQPPVRSIGAGNSYQPDEGYASVLSVRSEDGSRASHPLKGEYKPSGQSEDNCCSEALVIQLPDGVDSSVSPPGEKRGNKAVVGGLVSLWWFILGLVSRSWGRLSFVYGFLRKAWSTMVTSRTGGQLCQGDEYQKLDSKYLVPSVQVSNCDGCLDGVGISSWDDEFQDTSSCPNNGEYQDADRLDMLEESRLYGSCLDSRGYPDRDRVPSWCGVSLDNGEHLDNGKMSSLNAEYPDSREHPDSSKLSSLIAEYPDSGIMECASKDWLNC